MSGSPGGRRGLRAFRGSHAAFLFAEVRSQVDLLDLGSLQELVAEEALGVRLLEVVGIEREEDALLHAGPSRLVGAPRRGPKERAGRGEPVQLEQPEAV